MKTTRQTRNLARKLFRFCVVDGQLDAARAREVTQKITENKRRGYIPLLWQFLRLVKLESLQHTAEVASALPLQSDLRQRIAADLEHIYGVGLLMRFMERPELIGGVRVSVGSDVYDDTVRYRLSLLEKNIKAGTGW